MDILISSAGKQLGPYSEEEAIQLLSSGQARLNDLACRRGLGGDWLPLGDLLGVDEADLAAMHSAPAPAPAPASTPEPRAEPATARQKAFLTYLGLPFTADLTKEKAALQINDAMENLALAPRVKAWDEDRLKLYPDLFAEELQARRENRSQVFLDCCLLDGADYFAGVTKAHTQVLVSYLDLHYPNWDGREDKKQIFFAAMAEKFPQLVKKSMRGKLEYPATLGGPAGLSGLAGVNRESSKSTRRSRGKSTVAGAVFRGIALGLLLLAALYGAYSFYSEHRSEVRRTVSRWFPEIDMGEEAPAEATPTPQPESPKRVAQAQPPKERVARKRTSTPAPEPTTPPESPAAKALTTKSAIPGFFEPTPAPVQSPANPGGAEAAPMAAALQLAEATPAPTPRTSVIIRKATEVALRFGSTVLPAGTNVHFVSMEGRMAVVRFGQDILRVPVANTDLAEQP